MNANIVLPYNLSVSIIVTMADVQQRMISTSKTSRCSTVARRMKLVTTREMEAGLLPRRHAGVRMEYMFSGCRRLTRGRGVLFLDGPNPVSLCNATESCDR